jgi:hypothetical protein
MPKIIETGETPRVSIETVIEKLLEIIEASDTFADAEHQSNEYLEQVSETSFITMKFQGQIWAMRVTVSVSDIPNIHIAQLFPIETCHLTFDQ